MPAHIVVRDRDRELTGVAHAGESWATAARRIAATTASVPTPLDLSGEPKLFAVDHDLIVAIRAMVHGDLPDLVRWLSTDHVHRWWAGDGESSADAVRDRYGPRIDGTTPTRLWVAEVNGRSVGFVQDYLIRDYPDYAILGPDPDAVGLDFAIGDPAWIGRGLGARILWAWMGKARHRFPEAAAYVAAPDHRNHASLRMLAKAGFAQGIWFDEPQSDGSVTTMVSCSLDVATVIG